ncbi:unnamed protein product [Echinostoma caproni]|uniref:Uncharacterized protein n=1 Tax=Echinostoma caproni TaxID=27848 RepID=A0A183B3E9_9TREM|nr:unnamed protein product [Echinostoma caproni]
MDMAHEQAKFNCFQDFILQLNNQVACCDYGDRLEEYRCDRLMAGINDLKVQGKSLEKNDLELAEARKICEPHDDLMQATSTEAVTLVQRQNQRPIRPPVAKHTPKPQRDPSGNEKHINPCLSCMRPTC